MADHPTSRPAAVGQFMARRRLGVFELLPWAAALAVYFLLPEYLPLGGQILIMVLFAMSLDLTLGYAGVVILGQAAFFGMGAYTAGLVAVNGWSEPLSGLAAAGAAAALLGAAAGAVILRTTHLALLMLGMALTLILHELANRLAWITGGFDGLRGIATAPLFGRFEFDIFGQTAFLYCLAVVFLVWLFMRALVHAPFGRSLVGIQENPERMEFIGCPVLRRKLIAFTISAGIAGLAGGLSAQTNQFVSLTVLSFDLSGTVLVILVLGGAGRLYGPFIGAPLYMIAQDQLSHGDPVYWLFWLGLILIAVVLFARNGLLGLLDDAHRQIQALVRRLLAPVSGRKPEAAGEL